MSFNKMELSILINQNVKSDIESLYHQQVNIKSFSIFTELILKQGIQAYQLALEG